jgi:hypothetical protein
LRATSCGRIRNVRFTSAPELATDLADAPFPRKAVVSATPIEFGATPKAALTPGLGEKDYTAALAFT